MGMIFPTLLYLQSCLTDVFPPVGLGCLLETLQVIPFWSLYLQTYFIGSRIFLVRLKSIFINYLRVLYNASPCLLLLSPPRLIPIPVSPNSMSPSLFSPYPINSSVSCQSMLDPFHLLSRHCSPQFSHKPFAQHFTKSLINHLYLETQENGGNFQRKLSI